MAKVGGWGKSVLLYALVSVMFLGFAGTGLAEHAGLSEIVPDQEIARYTQVKSLSGRLTIAGSSTMQPMLKRMGREFSVLNPDVKVAVENVGSNAAIRQFIIGFSTQRRGDKARGSGHEGAAQTTILASSRKLTDKELATFRARYGYDPIEIPVAMDAVAIYVHKDNPIKELTLDQVDAIFSTTGKRGLQRITSWAKLGLQDGGENQPIHLYGRNRESGTHDFFELVALDGGALREDVIFEAGSASEVLAIARDPLAIGFAGIGFQTSLVRTVPLAEHANGQSVMPSRETVSNRTYPMSRFLYLYVNQAPDQKFDPELLEFLKFVNSLEGQRVVNASGNFSLPYPIVAQNLNLLNNGTITASLPSSNTLLR